MEYKINITILGGCEVTVRHGEETKTVDFTSRKRWTLFEYLYFNRNQCTSLALLKEALWGDEVIRNPSNSVKVLVYEIRKAFDQAFQGLGKRIIRQKYGGYYLYEDKGIIFECDEELFERASLFAMNTKRLEDIRHAKRSYLGHVQITNGSTMWQIMLQKQYQAYYEKLVQTEIECLALDGNMEEAVKTCADAILLFPEGQIYKSKYNQLKMEYEHGNTGG